MGTFSTFDTSASGIYAQRVRLNTIANNIANAETTRTESGNPYRRQLTVFRAKFMDAMGQNIQPVGVTAEKIVDDDTDYRMAYMPGHPDADESGYVKFPNVNVVEEMTDLVAATRAYEANIAVLNATKQIINQSIDIGK